ncbi:hypothetical protein L1049_024216 [Liquidambar formosana]|uniref:Uncharacterized protein n=1 Tax=Liquidambar formosana TaxID=63359 RepID=A0AAP0RU36_LIQFO
MICSLISCDLGFLYRAVRAMGCFFGCFRIRDDHNRPQAHLVSQSGPSKTREAVISQNRLSSLFLSEDSPCKDKESHILGSSQPDIVDRELKDEAKFLKACGTLPETPAEIRNASEKLKGSPLHDRDSEPSKFHSWLPNTSINELHLDKQPDQPPTPIKLCEEWGKGSVDSEHTPISCISDAQNKRSISNSFNEGSGLGSGNVAIKVYATQTDDITTSVSPWLSATNVQRRNKSVRFECESGCGFTFLKQLFI